MIEPDEPPRSSVATLLAASMANAYAGKVDELFGIIDEAAEALDLRAFAALSEVSQALHARRDFDLLMRVEEALRAMTSARSILAEANPVDLETPGPGPGGADG